MERDISLGTWIMNKIEEKKLTKTMVYQGAGITQSGFLKMIRNNSMKLEVFEAICESMAVNPCEYLNLKHPEYIQMEYSSNVSDLVPNNLKSKKVGTETKDFYERQIESLTRIIENLSEVVKTDTSINNT